MDRVGQDDSNDGPGECPSHEWWPVIDGWRIVPGTLRLERVYECPHCGAVTVMGPGEYAS